MSNQNWAPAALKKGGTESADLPHWKYRDHQGKETHSERCWNTFAGCKQYFARNQFNYHAGLCMGCATAWANEWNIDYEDISFLMTVFAAKQGFSLDPNGEPVRKLSPEDIAKALLSLGITGKGKPKKAENEHPGSRDHLAAISAAVHAVEARSK